MLWCIVQCESKKRYQGACNRACVWISGLISIGLSSLYQYELFM